MRVVCNAAKMKIAIGQLAIIRSRAAHGLTLNARASPLPKHSTRVRNQAKIPLNGLKPRLGQIAQVELKFWILINNDEFYITYSLLLLASNSRGTSLVVILYLQTNKLHMYIIQ